MFPGALGISEHLDNDEWDISPPTTQQVQGFLLYEQLALVPRGNYDWMVWFWELVHLLTVKGRYRALLDWAEVSPHVGPCVPWEGEFTRTASMADIATYLTANSITPHDADDILIWAQRAAALDLLRMEVNDPQPLGENHSKEWVEVQAGALRISTECIAAYKARPFTMEELHILQEFATAVLLYDLPHDTGVEGQSSGGKPPVQDDGPEEGEMRDEPAPM
ncbi:hypothetical protein PISMIDRAFT_10358 [Pisolithus microcarpus 441]|uniref:Uncharacterized protein n=1 Tax=Pisolithus microcarpus 441 TaxID=765257 RepID=A0A0C9Z513_9AGAM|nr:hypothetical protein PISMIDRAFT_10358 [Pisolithus microcarpus 441]